MPPPAPVDGADLTGKERERFAAGMFDALAPKYVRLNRLITWGSDDRWRRAAIAAAGIAPGDTVLDLGTGTGDLYIPAYRAVQPGGRVIGLDISANMLGVAESRIRDAFPDAAPQLHVRSADATELPDASVDVVLMGWVLRNVGDRSAAYREILRVLKPGGRFACIETSRPGFWPFRAGNYLYCKFIMPNIVRLVGGDRASYEYLAKTTVNFPRRHALTEEWTEAGFRDVRSRPLMLGSIALHVGRK